MSSFHQPRLAQAPSTPTPNPPLLTHTPPSSTTPLTLGPLTVRILSTTPYTTVTHLTLPPHTRGFPLLANRLHSVTYYILSGSLHFSFSTTTPKIPQTPNPPPSSSSSSPPPQPQPSTVQLHMQTFTAAESHTITIPPSTIHCFGNGDSEAAQVLCVYSPGTWVGALRELSGKRREDWSGVLRGWGCEVFEQHTGGDSQGEQSGEGEGEDDDEDEDELTHVPARLRCMAG